MAVPSRTLIDALRSTADRLGGGAKYNWTHMGACNCGHLAQTVTEFSAAEIHAIALEKAGDWHEQVIDHCPASGLPMDHLIHTLLELGLSRADLAHLERLSGAEVLRALPEGQRELDYRRRSHVVLYMRTLADVLEARLTTELARVAEGGEVRSGHSKDVASA
ncbi:MAG: hypothetical protein AAFU79_13220 [Myxococcota bacterium]